MQPLYEIQISMAKKQSFAGIQPCLFIYILSVAAFLQLWQGWIVGVETYGPYNLMYLLLASNRKTANLHSNFKRTSFVCLKRNKWKDLEAFIIDNRDKMWEHRLRLGSQLCHPGAAGLSLSKLLNFRTFWFALFDKWSTNTKLAVLLWNFNEIFCVKLQANSMGPLVNGVYLPVRDAFPFLWC